MLRISSLALLALTCAAACGREAAPIELPQPISETSPFEFPVALWDQKVEGESVLLVHVTANGQVDSVYIHESSGHAAFDSAAVAGARALRFRPAYRGDERIAMWARLPVRFSRNGVTADGLEAVQP